MSTALIFNGQGAHYQGMGMDFIQTYPQAKQVIETASQATALDVLSLLGDDFELLKETAYAQPAVSAVSLAIFESIKEKLPPVSYMAGLSLGEYSALMANETLTYADGFALLKERARLMSDHCKQLKKEQEVSMEAVLLASPQIVEDLVSQVQNQGEKVFVANYNSSSQTVIAGQKKGLQLFKQLAREEGIKKTIPLAVEGPFHTPFMQEIIPAFSSYLDRQDFHPGKTVVVSNTTAQPHQVEKLPSTLSRHLVQAVYWKQTIDFFLQSGVDRIIQIGPGKTLANLLKREKNHPPYLVVDKVDDVEKISDFLGGK